MTIDDVDCVVHGNMELFEMVHQPDLWHALGTGAYGKECLRVTTGGTTGATLVCGRRSSGGIRTARCRPGHRF